MGLFLRVSAIVAILLGFLSAGFVAGEHIEAEKTAHTQPSNLIPSDATVGSPSTGVPIPPDATIGSPSKQ